MKMVEVKTYKLPATRLIPNSPEPLIHYPGLLSEEKCITLKAHDLFTNYGWQTQWINRYGDTQEAHYHSAAHECMVVLTGSATIRFGVADLDDDSQDSGGKEDGGIEIPARLGDVFILPAGLAHKTFNAQPRMPSKFLTPGDGHSIAAKDIRKELANTELSGFTMLGAYPEGSVWDWSRGGDSEGAFEDVWRVPLPKNDPVLGQSSQGLRGLWTGGT